MTKTVLIIDSDPATAATIGDIAENGGYISSISGDFADFREKLNGQTTVVVDLLMPDADGIEVIRYLADCNCEAGLILTSNVHNRVAQAAERLASAQGLAVLGSLSRPLDPDALRTLLIDRKRPQSRRRKNKPGFCASIAEVEAGINADQLVVYFQPKIDVRTLDFVAVEALVRWQHPEHGLLSPPAFVPLAERKGLVGKLTEKVVDLALSQCREWRAGELDLKVAINFSPRSLSDLNLPDWLCAKAEEYGIETQNIVVEMTESWLGRDAVATLDTLTRLRLKGFELSIDDFGTGYSTMANLKEMPFSELKLDQSFIRGAATDPDARSIVESSIWLGQKLGLHLVAEGIEKQEDWDLISELGCDEGQGYFIARPMRGDDVPGWLRVWNSSLGHT